MWFLSVLASGAIVRQTGPIQEHVDIYLTMPYMTTVIKFIEVSNTSDILTIDKERFQIKAGLEVKINPNTKHAIEASNTSTRLLNISYEPMPSISPPPLLASCKDSEYGVDGTPLTYDECRQAIRTLMRGDTTSKLNGDGCFLVADEYSRRLQFFSEDQPGAVKVTKCGKRRRRNNVEVDECQAYIKNELEEMEGYSEIPCLHNSDCLDQDWCMANLVPTGICVSEQVCKKLGEYRNGSCTTDLACGDLSCAGEVFDFTIKLPINFFQDSSGTQNPLILSRLTAKSTCNGHALDEKQCRAHADTIGATFYETSHVNFASQSPGCYTYGSKDVSACDATQGACDLRVFYKDGCFDEIDESEMIIEINEVCSDDGSQFSTAAIVGIVVGSIIVLSGLALAMYLRSRGQDFSSENLM